MGRYDNLDKEYFSAPKRLAELISNGVYHGRVKVSPDDLIILGNDYPSLASASGEVARDSLCLCKSHGIKYGFEIENHQDYGMPRRVMVYDACEYEKEARQMRERHENDKDLCTFDERKSGMTKAEGYCPIITAVLYLGQGHYDGNISLRDCMKFSGEIHGQVHDKIQNYAFPLIEADYENPARYESELKQFFQAMQSRYDKKKLNVLLSQEDFQHLTSQTQKMIVTHLGLKELKKAVVEEEKDMCKAWRDLKKEWREEALKEGRELGIKQGRELGIKQGREQGIEQGIEQGREETLLKISKKLMGSLQLTAEQVVDMLNLTGEERQKIIGKI